MAGKRFVRDHDGADLLGFAESRDIGGAGPPQSKRCEGLVVLAIAQIHRRGEAHVAGGHGLELRGVPDANQAIRIGVGQRPNQDGVDDAEDGRGGTDTERQRDDGGKRKTGITPDHPQRQPQVLRQRLDPANAARVVGVFAKTQCVPELPPRRCARLLR
jgi:hypothetical protein